MELFSGALTPLRVPVEVSFIILSLDCGNHWFIRFLHRRMPGMMLPPTSTIHATFACHQETPPVNPSESHLLLETKDDLGNHRNEVERMTGFFLFFLSTNNSRKIWLAYISARCAEQARKTRLADETKHPASNFQVAELSHVARLLCPTKLSFTNVSCRARRGLIQTRPLQNVPHCCPRKGMRMKSPHRSLISTALV